MIEAVVLISTNANDMEGMNIGLVKNDTSRLFPLKLYFVTLREAKTPINISNIVAITAILILFANPVTKSVCPVKIF